MSTSPRPAVRVVCVTYHPGPELADFARSLRTATTADVELVIVDNGTDPSAAQAVARAHGARVEAPGRNLGYGTGRGPRILLCLEGEVTVAASGDASLTLSRGQSAFVPAADGHLTAQGRGTLVQADVP